MWKYNTQKKPLPLKEYGRNIQQMLDQIINIGNKVERTKKAYEIVDYMIRLNQKQVNTTEYTIKVWNDIFIISNYQLDIDSPYPKPEKLIDQKKPQRMMYNINPPKLKNYGKNIELTLKKIANLDTEEEQTECFIKLAKFIKNNLHNNFSESLEANKLIKNLNQLTSQPLKIHLQEVQKVLDKN